MSAGHQSGEGTSATALDEVALLPASVLKAVWILQRAGAISLLCSRRVFCHSMLKATSSRARRQPRELQAINVCSRACTAVAAA